MIKVLKIIGLEKSPSSFARGIVFNITFFIFRTLEESKI